MRNWKVFTTCILIAAGGVWTHPALGEPSSPFTITTASGDQIVPDVAAEPMGHQFVVAWRGGSKVDARTVSRQAGLGNVFTVLSTTSLYSHAAACRLTEPGTSGECIVAAQGPAGKIIAQRFNPNGTLVGGVFTVEVPPNGYSSSIDVAVAAADPRGSGPYTAYLVVYPDYRNDLWAIYGRTVDSSGTVGTEYRYSSSSNDAAFFGLSVAYNPLEHQFMVVWNDRTTDDIQGRRVDATTGAGLGIAPFTISPTTNPGVETGVAYQNATQDYLVVWEEYGGALWKIYGRNVTSAGATPGPAFPISPASVPDARNPDVAHCAGGLSKVVWEQQETVGGGYGDIYAQLVLPSGALSGSVIPIATTASKGEENVTIACESYYDVFLAAYNVLTNGWDVHGEIEEEGGPGPDDAMVYAGTTAGSLYAIWPWNRIIAWARTGLGYVRSVAATPTGSAVVAGTATSLYLFDSSGVQLGSVGLGVPFGYGSGYVEQSQVAISGDGPWVVAAHSDGTVRLYDGALVQIWSYSAQAQAVAITVDGRSVAATGNGWVAYFDAGSDGLWGTPDDQVPRWVDAGVPGLTVDIGGSSADEVHAVVGTTNSQARLYGGASSTPIWTYTCVPGALISVAMNALGDRVAAGNDNASDTAGAQLHFFTDLMDGACGWSAADGTPLWSFDPSQNPANPCDDCRAIEFPRWANKDDRFASGGCCSFKAFQHDSSSSVEVWEGSDSIDDIAVFFQDDHYGVAGCAIVRSSVEIYYSDTTSPSYPPELPWRVPLDGRCTSVAAGDPPCPGGCDDGNPCTRDVCDPLARECVFTQSCACDDENPCTDDSCNPAIGCVFVPNDNRTCSDGNACTTQDVCRGGQCTCDSVGACEPQATSYSNATPVAIPTGPAVVSSTITVANADPYLAKVRMTTSIAHSSSTDLDVTLTSPSGTVVTITSDNGGTNDNVFNGTRWDDEADPDSQIPYGATNPNIVTNHAYANNVTVPDLTVEEALSAFIGENPNGVWTLRISDDLANDGGVLGGWELGLDTLPQPPTTAATTFWNVTPLPIPDNAPSPATSTIAAAGLADQIGRVRLTTFITHTFPGDLEVTLRSPAGTVSTIAYRRAGTADNVFNGTLWDDEADPGNPVPFPANVFAASNLVTDTTFTANVVKATLVPEEAMAAFNGENPNGTWTLSIRDSASGDTGVLERWSLEIGTTECSLSCAVQCQDDGDPCTHETCDPTLGCHAPVTCDDQDACTNDSCDRFLGCVHTVRTCNDGSACTSDRCDSLLGCVFTPVDCDDGNSCTADACDAISGCWHLATPGQPCDDGNPCSGPDVCAADQCIGSYFAPDDPANVHFHDEVTLDFDPIPGIRAATLYLQSDPTANPATLYAQATRLDIGMIQWYEFVFASPIAITPDRTYHIRVASAANGVRFMRHDAAQSEGESDYPGGQFFRNGLPLDPSNPPGQWSDAYFTTYSVGGGGGCSTPEDENAGWTYGHGAGANTRTFVLAQSFTPNRSYSVCKVRVVLFDDEYNTHFDVLRGQVSLLPVGPGNLDEICEELDIPPVEDPTIPNVGTGLFYVIRAERGCGDTSFGNERHNTAGSPEFVPRITTTCP